MINLKSIQKQAQQRRRAKEQADKEKHDAQQLRLTNSEGASVTIARDMWRAMLQLAQRYGWVALGTMPPTYLTGKEWQGSIILGGYERGEGEWLNTADASALAAALGLALGDGMPDATMRRNHENVIAVLSSPGIAIYEESI